MANYSINKLRGGLKIMFDKPCGTIHNVSSAMTSHYHAMKRILAFSLACFLAIPALAQLAGVDAFSPIGEHHIVGQSGTQTLYNGACLFRTCKVLQHHFWQYP